MIIIMKQGTTHEHVEELSQHIERWNVKANPIYGEDTIVIGLVGDTGAVDKDALMLDPQVENIIKVQEPFKLANRKFHPDNSVVEIAPGVVVGGKKLVVMAGPCSVESEEQIIDVAKHVQADGATVLRGGAWKPRSSPYSFQGLKAEGLELLHKAHEATGLPVVTEITNPAHIDIFMDKCDCFQVGARNMQNFELLKELGQTPQAHPAQARLRQHHGGVPDERRVHHGGRQRERYPLRARHPHLREVHPQHAGYFRRSGAQAHEPSAGRR